MPSISDCLDSPILSHKLLEDELHFKTEIGGEIIVQGAYVADGYIDGYAKYYLSDRDDVFELGEQDASKAEDAIREYANREYIAIDFEEEDHEL